MCRVHRQLWGTPNTPHLSRQAGHRVSQGPWGRLVKIDSLSRAVQSLLGLLGPTRKGRESPPNTWRLPPSALFPRNRQNTRLPRVYVCCGFLRAPVLLGIAPFAVFEHPQALPRGPGRKLGGLASLGGGRRGPAPVGVSGAL